MGLGFGVLGAVGDSDIRLLQGLVFRLLGVRLCRAAEGGNIMDLSRYCVLFDPSLALLKPRF